MSESTTPASVKSTAKDVSVIGVVGLMLSAYLSSDLSGLKETEREILLLGVPLVAALVASFLGVLNRWLDELSAMVRVWNAKRKVLKILRDPNVTQAAKDQAQEMYDQYSIIECAPRMTLSAGDRKEGVRF